MAVLRRGGGGGKNNGYWPFCITKVGMDVVPKLCNLPYGARNIVISVFHTDLS